MRISSSSNCSPYITLSTNFSDEPTLYAFTGNTDGANPSSALLQGSDGYLYGTTTDGGTNYRGDVYKISTNGALTILYSFTGGTDGDYVSGPLVYGHDGYFYGTTSDGGLYTNQDDFGGTVFKISTNGAFTSLCSFNWDYL
jgi:uncharacterized repeat protein (TIGR03803 family)